MFRYSRQNIILCICLTFTKVRYFDRVRSSIFNSREDIIQINLFSTHRLTKIFRRMTYFSDFFDFEVDFPEEDFFDEDFFEEDLLPEEDESFCFGTL